MPFYVIHFLPKSTRDCLCPLWATVWPCPHLASSIYPLSDFILSFFIASVLWALPILTKDKYSKRQIRKEKLKGTEQSRQASILVLSASGCKPLLREPSGKTTPYGLIKEWQSLPPPFGWLRMPGLHTRLETEFKTNSFAYHNLSDIYISSIAWERESAGPKLLQNKGTVTSQPSSIAGLSQDRTKGISSIWSNTWTHS